MKKIIALLGLSLILLGCVTAVPPAAAKIIEADEEMIKACKFIGTMTGKSSLGVTMPETGEANAKTDLLVKAAAKGATHVVWKEVYFNGWGWRVNGRVYQCQ